MLASFHAFACGLIDYAGIFPPARLRLDAAVDNYLRYRQAPGAWLLSRFICPAGRLKELARLLPEAPDPGLPFHLSVLIGGGEQDHYHRQIEEDLHRIARFVTHHGDKVKIGFLETTLPTSAVETCETIQRVDQFVATEAPPGTSLFYEISLRDVDRKVIADLIGGIAERTKAQSGFKLRCGGESAAAVPSTEEVAFLLATCRNAGLRWKATAGLHHPIRHHDENLATMMHGFINLFGAGLLAHACRLDEVTIRELLEETDPRAFRFTETGLVWRDHEITTEEIAAYREKAITSFGSCSFTEPRDDLQALGLLRDAKEKA